MLCAAWPGLATSDDLERVLADFVQRAAAGWPELVVAPERLLQFVAPHLAPSQPTPVDVARLPAQLAAAPASDLHLACACSDGVERALASFETVLGAVRPAIASLGAGVADIDEVLQRLRVQLLMGSPPGISAYGGRGDLRSWLRVIAVREAVRLLRERGRSERIEDDGLFDAIAPGLDAEHDVISAELRAAFRAAFAEAMAALEPRERLILRQHGIDDLGIDQIGALYGVHRATAARWIERARVSLAAVTEQRLHQRLGASIDEVRLLLARILSRTDASIGRLLGPSSDRD